MMMVMIVVVVMMLMTMTVISVSTNLLQLWENIDNKVTTKEITEDLRATHETRVKAIVTAFIYNPWSYVIPLDNHF